MYLVRPQWSKIFWNIKQFQLRFVTCYSTNLLFKIVKVQGDVAINELWWEVRDEALTCGDILWSWIRATLLPSINHNGAVIANSQQLPFEIYNSLEIANLTDKYYSQVQYSVLKPRENNLVQSCWNISPLFPKILPPLFPKVFPCYYAKNIPSLFPKIFPAVSKNISHYIPKYFPVIYFPLFPKIFPYYFQKYFPAISKNIFPAISKNTSPLFPRIFPKIFPRYFYKYFPTIYKNNSPLFTKIIPRYFQNISPLFSRIFPKYFPAISNGKLLGKEWPQVWPSPPWDVWAQSSCRFIRASNK